MNQAALTKLKLNPTAQGIKVFNIKFAAACGPMLTMSLKDDKTITRMTGSELARSKLIFNALIGTMDDMDDVVLEMVGEASAACAARWRTQHSRVARRTACRYMQGGSCRPLRTGMCVSRSLTFHT